MFPLAERKRQKFTLALFLSFRPTAPPLTPSDCHHAAQWHRANDVIIQAISQLDLLTPELVPGTHYISDDAWFAAVDMTESSHAMMFEMA